MALGHWAKTYLNPNGGGTELPSVTASDNGKVLGVDGGEYKLVEGSVADGSVTTAKLANNAVTVAKLANGSVAETKLASNVLAKLAPFTYRSDSEAYGALEFYRIGKLCIAIPTSNGITIAAASSGSGLIFPEGFKLSSNAAQPGKRIGIGTDANGAERLLICAGNYGTNPLIMLFNPKTDSSIDEGGTFFGILVYEAAD